MDSNHPSLTYSMDWGDMSMFSTSQFEDGMPAESPFGASAFNDFTTLDAYDSPAGLTLRTPSKSVPESVTIPGAQNTQHMSMISSASAESSSQDSASDSSSRRKRKTSDSESPVFDQITDIGARDVQVKQEDVNMALRNLHQVWSFESTFSQPMHNLSLEQGIGGTRPDNGLHQFDYNSAASSPIQAGDFNSAMSLDAHVNMPASSVVAQYNQESPIQTINPGMFTIGGSRDQSPATNNMMFNQPSPNAIFSTPSSDGQDFANPKWNTSLTQNPPWPGDFTSQLTSPGTVAFTPSPVTNGGTPAASNRAAASRMGRSPLHIAPISTKSRVETQINVVMTLEKPPTGIEYLHLPLHTIAKSKLLAKEDYEKSKFLELYTMLVCTSAMRDPQCKEKALQRAATASNEEIQRRAELARETGDEDKNDPKNVEEADKPANGGEVRICSNCIQRERKRAGRKKTKREEEQQHWERFESERVVVFNSNEYLPWKSCESGPQLHRDSDGEQYMPPDGALYATAAMRIACYCRHQSEKEGFQVIFTLKDQHGNVVAQQISDSILITDDHKTHPQSFSAAVPGDAFYQGGDYLPNGLSISHSMVDMTAHAQPFTSSRSAGNLQALYNSAQFNPHSHVHQLPGTGYTCQPTPTTITPNSLSRPGSPTSAGQVGPNKKRKSSAFHRKVPSGLTMTPMVDTSQPPSSNLPSAISMNSQFSPTNTNFSNQLNASYMTIPNNNGSAQYFGSGPPTPNENAALPFSQPQVDISRVPNNQAYFSHPSSAVPSRSSSPVLQQTRANMAAYARQQPVQALTNTNARSTMFATQVDQGNSSLPVISRITPMEGPVSGGTEVAILGDNFLIGMSVAFGDQTVPTSYISPTSLLTMAPPSRPGSVHLSLIPPQGQTRYPEPAGKPIYRYTSTKDEMMVMALKYLSEQYQGNVDNWQSFAQQSATSFIQSRVSRADIQQHGYPAGYTMSAETETTEDALLKIFDSVDMSDGPHPANLELASAHGSTMLSLACSFGMHRVVAALLARGANVDARDRSGYTPLMHAALQGRPKIFQLLISRGADPIIRSLRGYSAIDLAPPGLRNELVQILLNTRRRRQSTPSLHSPLSCYSTTSSNVSWDIESALLYESEDTSSDENDVSDPICRRQNFESLREEGKPAARRGCSSSSSSAAMLAWRDMPPAQIHLFQETPHLNTPLSFHLPPLPSLPSYQTLSSFVPGHTSTLPAGIVSPCRTALDRQSSTRQFEDALSILQDTSVPGCPPPAYHDLFPEEKLARVGRKTQDTTVHAAVVKARRDEKRAFMYERLRDTGCVSLCASSALVPFPSKSGGALCSIWLWVSIIVMVTSVILHPVAMHFMTHTVVETVTTALSRIAFVAAAAG